MTQGSCEKVGVTSLCLRRELRRRGSLSTSRKCRVLRGFPRFFHDCPPLVFPDCSPIIHFKSFSFCRKVFASRRTSERKDPRGVIPWGRVDRFDDYVAFGRCAGGRSDSFFCFAFVRDALHCSPIQADSVIPAASASAFHASHQRIVRHQLRHQSPRIGEKRGFSIGGFPDYSPMIHRSFPERRTSNPTVGGSNPPGRAGNLRCFA